MKYLFKKIELKGLIIIFSAVLCCSFQYNCGRGSYSGTENNAITGSSQNESKVPNDVDESPGEDEVPSGSDEATQVDDIPEVPDDANTVPPEQTKEDDESNKEVSTEITIRVVGIDDKPIENAFVMLGIDSTTEFKGKTDVDGQIVFKGDNLDDPQTVTAAKAGYRNYTIVNSTAQGLTITLKELERKAGWVNVSIDETSWGDLEDNIDWGNGIFEVRCALLVIPANDLEDNIDSTECESCIGQSPFLIPLDPNQAEKKMPVFLDQKRVIVVGGLLQFGGAAPDPSNLIIEFTKFGIGEFSLDESNTVDNPANIEVSFTHDFDEDTWVEVNLFDQSPSELTETFMLFSVDLPNYGFGWISGVMGMNIGATEITEDISYRFPALSLSDILSDENLAEAGYVIQAGLSNEDFTKQSFTLMKADISDEAQSVNIESLLDSVSTLNPLSGDLLDLDELYKVDFSWKEIDDVDLYLSTIGRPYFNGTELNNKVIWYIVTPPGITDFILPELPSDDAFAGLKRLESCEFYQWETVAASLTGFSYNSGLFNRVQDLIFDHLPVLVSMSAQPFFSGEASGASGDICSPIISKISPNEASNGSEVTLSGMYFGSNEGVVNFGGNTADIVSWTDTSITITAPDVPDEEIIVEVTIEADGKVSNTAYFLYRNN